MKHGRARALGLVVMAAIGLGLTAAIPTSAAVSTDVVRLRLTSHSQFFAWGSTNQNLRTASNGCQLTSSEPIIDLSSTPTGSEPGLKDDGLGVKQPGGSNGTPCSQTESTESLRLSRGTALGSRLFESVRLDLEMTGNAVVLLTLASGTQSASYRLQTGTSITSDQSGEIGIRPHRAIPGQFHSRRRDRRLRRAQQLGSEQRQQRQLPVAGHPGLRLPHHHPDDHAGRGVARRWW